MFNTRALFSFLIFSLVGGASVNAMAQPIDEVALDRVDCPLTLQPQKPLGWSVVEKEPAHVLQRMAFFSDHPEYGEELGPQEHRRKDNLVLERWTFQTEGKHPWMACVYDGTSAMVARPVPSGVKFCDARYSVEADETHVLKWVVCREH